MEQYWAGISPEEKNLRAPWNIYDIKSHNFANSVIYKYLGHFTDTVNLGIVPILTNLPNSLNTLEVYDAYPPPPRQKKP